MNHFENFRRGARAAAFQLSLLAAPGYAQLRASGEPITPAETDVTSGDTSVRPFQVHVPESALADLRQRLAAARLPDQEVDPSQGVRLAIMTELVRYRRTDYDWRKVEARLNAPLSAVALPRPKGLHLALTVWRNLTSIPGCRLSKGSQAQSWGTDENCRRVTIGNKVVNSW